MKSSGFEVTLPLASMSLTRFWNTVDLAQRKSPLAASKLHMMEVLHGTPVRVLRLADAMLRPTANIPLALGSGATLVVIGIISKVHSWSALSCGNTWCFQAIFPVFGSTAKRVLVPARVALPLTPRWVSEDGPTPLEP